jgi:hypothetical protein
VMFVGISVLTYAGTATREKKSTSITEID